MYRTIKRKSRIYKSTFTNNRITSIDEKSLIKIMISRRIGSIGVQYSGVNIRICQHQLELMRRERVISDA